MDAKFSTSFIPKQNMAKAVQPFRSSNISVLAIAGIAIFIIVIALGAGIYLYNQNLRSDLKKLDSEIADRKASFELGKIDEVKLFNRRMTTAKSLLAGHVAFTQFFAILEENTMPNVSFKNLSYQMLPVGARIQMQGIADGFSAIALQSDAFIARPELSGHIFSNFKLKSNGFVEFNYEAIVAKTAISYSSLINAKEAEDTE